MFRNRFSLSYSYFPLVGDFSSLRGNTEGDETMQGISQRQVNRRFGVLQFVILLLVAATALIHLSRGVALGMPALKPFPLLFYLNTIGYLVLGAALFFPGFSRFQRPIRWVLVGYAAITVILWFLITGAHPALLAYIDKPIELALIILLIFDDQQAQKLQN